MVLILEYLYAEDGAWLQQAGSRGPRVGGEGPGDLSFLERWPSQGRLGRHTGRGRRGVQRPQEAREGSRRGERGGEEVQEGPHGAMA